MMCHLPIGEMTVTLDNVSSLLHMPILRKFAKYIPLEYNGVATILVEEGRVKAEMRQCRNVHVRLSWLREVYDE